MRFSTRQRVILLLLLGASFMFAVDFSILNVALPEAGAGVGLSKVAWITTAYALPAAGFTLLFGRLADVIGRRRLFMTGVALLAGASLLGGFASTPEVLLIARALQGFATAMATPAALSLLTTTFTEGALRDRALGLNGALLSGGFTVGALVGGALVSLLGWRAAFFINVPVALAILALTPFLVIETTRSRRANLDIPGAVTVTGGLLAVIYAAVEKDLLAAVIGVALLAAFWIIELRSPAPLAPVRILKRPTVKWGNYAGFIVFTMEPAMIFLLTLYLQQVLGFAPLATGLIFGIPGLASVAAGVIAGRFIGRFGSHKVLTTGLAVQGLATLPLIFTGTGRLALLLVIPALFIGFFGHVTAIVAYTVTATSGLPDTEQGLATGLTSMTQQVAITIGIPLLSTLPLHPALTLNVALTLISVLLIHHTLRPHPTQPPTSAARTSRPINTATDGSRIRPPSLSGSASTRSRRDTGRR